MRMLIIEDSENDRDMLKRFLSKYCSTIHECSTLVEAMELCRTHTFDLIIADLRLEDTDVETTLAALHDIKKLQPQSGLLVCSGMPIPDLRQRSLNAGADRFVEKTPQLYQDNAKVLLLSVNAAMMHQEPAGRGDHFMRSVHMLRAIAETPH